jgi:hypothetical protein
MAAVRSLLALFAVGLVAACGGDSPSGPTFTVGGTVAGLSGAGLVLQNNGGNNLSVGSGGNFTFTSGVASGGTYNVTVLTQPAHQTCTVSNGSGTVASANVTNVAVTCTTSTFTIGGEVSGFSGAGLVLQNNGGNNLTITANGTFTFSTPVASGTLYTVTVLTQPANQTCEISNPSGTVTAKVVNVLVTCTSFLASYEVVPATATTGAAGTLGTATATCPSTRRVIGGGYRSASGSEVWRVWRSKPVDASGTGTGDRGWAISFTSVVAGQSVTVYAVCVIPQTTLGYEVVSSTAVTTGAVSSGGTVALLCPGVKRVMSGGFSPPIADEVWRLRSSGGIGDGGAQTNRGWSVDFTSVQAGHTVSAHAVCAQAPQGMGHDIVTFSATTGAVGTTGTVSVMCQGTGRVLSGGFVSAAGCEVWRVWRSFPSDANAAPGDRGWTVDFTSVVAGQTVTAFAICAGVPS